MLPALLASAQVAVVELHADLFAREFARFQLLFDPFAIFADLGTVVVAAVDRQDDDVLGGQTRRQDEAVVVAVRHEKGADQPRGNAPRRRPSIGFAARLVLEFDFLGSGEVLPEEVGGPRLQGFAVLHHGFDRIRGDGSRKAFAGRFFPFDDRHGHLRLGEVGIHVEHFHRLFAGLGLGGVGRVALLPEKLGRAEKHPRPHLPADDVGPLVNQDRQVAIRLHPFARTWRR